MISLRRALLGILLFASGLLSIGEAGAERRVALVVGNAAYKHAATLPNPRNDAADMSSLLRRLNFEVIEGNDLDKAAMDRTIRRFADQLAGSNLALLFYAGHGLQVGGHNYLVPIDAKLTSSAALDFEMVRLDLLQRTMEREATTNVLIIDACRDNPLARNLARALGTRSAAIGRGLAAMESGEGTLISFSTQPGNVAFDGKGRNSPFAAALLRYLPVPGDDLPSILINVRKDVVAATGKRQVPWEHSALTARVFFTRPASSTESSFGSGVPNNPSLEQQIELSFWASVKDSQNPVVLRTYLIRYPEGVFAPIARALIAEFERADEGSQSKPAQTKSPENSPQPTAQPSKTVPQSKAWERVVVDKLPIPKERVGADKFQKAPTERETRRPRAGIPLTNPAPGANGGSVNPWAPPTGH